MGQYAILAEAIRQAGGEVRLGVRELEAAVMGERPHIEVDASDGPVVLRLVEGP